MTSTDAHLSAPDAAVRQLWPTGEVATRGAAVLTAATDPAHHARLAGLLQPAGLYVLGVATPEGVPGTEVHGVPLTDADHERWPQCLTEPDSPLACLPDGPRPRVIDLTAGRPALRLALAETARRQDLRFVLDEGRPYLRPVVPAATEDPGDACDSHDPTPAIGLPEVISRAATHDHMFHADDVLAGAILRLTYPGVTFDRTREPERWAKADVVFDVGGRYGVGLKDGDAAPYVYDHHQRNGPVRGDGRPFASFGLLWRELGVRVCDLLLPHADADVRRETCDVFGAEFVRSVDDHDNTGRSDHPGAKDVIKAIRLHGPVIPPGEDTPSSAFDAAFEKAVEFGGQMIRRTLFKLQQRIETVPKVEAAVTAALAADADHLVFDFDHGGASLWEPVVQRLDPDGRLRWVTFDRGNGWIVRNVRTALGTEALFPESWRGRENEAASEATGVPGTVFVHRSGFLAVHETLDGARRLMAGA